MNSRYFHHQATYYKRRNHITCLHNSKDERVKEKEGLEEHIVQYFSELFSS